MARNDDDDDDRPAKKRREEGDDDRPRKKIRARDEDEESDERGAGATPMPPRLVGAIILSMAWSVFMLYGSCLHSGNSILTVIEIGKMQRQQQEFREKMRAAGNKNFDPGEMRIDTGIHYTLVGARVFLFLMSALLFGGGMALLMRKGFGKYLVIGAPVGMVVVDLIGFGVALIVTRWVFMAQHNVEFLVTIFMCLVVAGCNGFLLMNKDVSRALK